MGPRKTASYQFSAFMWSAALHGLVFLLVIVGLPEIWREHRESLPVAMSVEVVSISDVTNIKRKAAQKKEKALKESVAKAKKAVSASSSSKKQKEQKKKVIAPPKKKEKPKPKKQKKPKEKPKPKPEKKKKEKTDLDSILKSVADAAKKEQGDKPEKSNKEVKKAVADDYNPSLPMSMTEIDAIRSQFIQCWNIPAGARNAYELKVVLDVRLRANGNVISAELAKETGRYYNDGFFRAAVDSAIRAVYRCSPIKNLPPNKYETWKYLQMTFDPKDMLY
jgi:outer membrane biosynthesis protein TonB